MNTKIAIRNLNAFYGKEQALKDITAEIPIGGITVVVGPSGCGKSTLLRCLNRLLEETSDVRVTGQVLLDGENIYARKTDVTEVRARVGLLAPKPCPLPMSIYDNVSYGRRIHGLQKLERRNGRSLDRKVEVYLRAAGLWEEVKDRLHAPASGLSTGQQQRLCLARALAVEPEVLLCDEPTSALDPISAQRIEEQLKLLSDETTVVIVSHSLRQARRLASHIIFLWMGILVEAGPAAQMLSTPCDERTRAYLYGDIG
jgi:phosphate transport system ATP-binding protein